MLEIQFPTGKTIHLTTVVCDLNGTLCLDGKLLEGVAAAIGGLKSKVAFYLLSADTNGTAQAIADQLGVRLQVLHSGDEARQKSSFIKTLGNKTCTAIGQGANDRLMLREAALGICVLSREGTAVKTMIEADLVVPDILSAFELLQKPTRIVASLRE